MQALLPVGAAIWFSLRAESGGELRAFVRTSKLFQLAPICVLQASRESKRCALESVL
jgi:hypothetical protein